jgi:hypothetical protein
MSDDWRSNSAMLSCKVTCKRPVCPLVSLVSEQLRYSRLCDRARYIGSANRLEFNVVFEDHRPLQKRRELQEGYQVRKERPHKSLAISISPG